MRRIEHTGPVGEQRRQAVVGRARPLSIRLPAGVTLIDALAGVLAAHGTRSAVARLRGGGFFPFAYVMPALSRTPAHAVYFSDRHATAAAVRLEDATVTIGMRDGQPFVHCHALWIDGQGVRGAGHVLPHEAVLLAGVEASITLLDGVQFEVGADAETGFTLFQPVACASTRSGGEAVIALRVAPNEDVCAAVEAECAARGIANARVLGGVGSIVGARFDDGRVVEPFVTEVLIREGAIASAPGAGPRARIDIALVDYQGGLAEGRLERGENPVLVTFELVLEPA